MQKKILILYGSVGQGHKTIAENIAGHLSAAGFNVKLADVLKEQEGWLVKSGKKIYHFISQTLPFVWSYLYMNGSLADFLMPYRIRVAAKNCENVKLIIAGFSPDMIITTHSNASAIAAHLKQQGFYKGLFGISFSDFHLHKFWLYWQADFYLANIAGQREDMVKMGVPAEKIFVCGMVLPTLPEADKEKIKGRLGIGPGRKVVLLAGGTYGSGLKSDLIIKLSEREGLSVVAVCGDNQKLHKALAGELKNTGAVVLGFYKPMDDLYAIADIFVTKAGGLSVSEALRHRLPILIDYVLPGQEELNFDYLIENGLVMPEPINLADEVEEELQTGSFAKSLKANPAVGEIIRDPRILVEAVNGMFGPVS